MNTPIVVDAGVTGIERSAKLIQAIGKAELILGFLCTAAATLYGQFALKHTSPADASFWASLSSPTTLRTLHIVWIVYLVSFFLYWHGFLCRRLQRPLRPIGFAVGILVTLKLAYNALSFGVVRLEMESLNFVANGNSVNLGNRFGIYADFIICIMAVLALLAACFAAFCASEKTNKALKSSDQALYTLDSIPLSVFLGFVLFICVGYGFLVDVIHPSPTLAGIRLPTLMYQALLLAFAVACALAAWAFYTRRPWGWFAGLLVGMAWALSSYYPPADISTFSGSEYDKYRDFLTQFTPAIQKYMRFEDIMIFMGLSLFVGYLVYVRRHLVDREPEHGSSKPPRPEVPIYTDWRRLKIHNKSWLIFGALGVIQWLRHDYFIAIVFIGITIMTVLIMLIGIFTPRYVFRKEGLALTGIGLLATPVFPYTSFKSVQLITTRKPPRPMRSIEDGVLNLNVSVFADDQRARLEEEFSKRGIVVTVLAPAAAVN